MPDDAIDGKLPHRIDSFSIMPGFEFDFPLDKDWILTPWLRAGASFAEKNSDGVLYGAGVRLERVLDVDDIGITQRHELGFVEVNYRKQRVRRLPAPAQRRGMCAYRRCRWVRSIAC